MIKVALNLICKPSNNIKWAEYDSAREFHYIDLTSVDRNTDSIIAPQIITAKNAPSRAQRIVYTDDVLFATTRPTLRRKCITPPQYNGQICSTGFCVLRPQKDKVLPKWVYYMLSADQFYDYIEPLQKGTSYPAITDNEVRFFAIPLPSIPEQQRIIDVLDKEFERIDKVKSNAELSLRHAKDLFQASLKKELEPKEGWKEYAIGEIAEIKGGKRVPKGYKLITQITNHPYIRVSDFNDNGSVSLNDIHYISDEVYEGIKRYTISSSDVYISIAGTIGKSGIIPDELNGSNLTENACKLVLKKGVFNRFMYCCTLSEGFKEQVTKMTMQAAQPKLALTRLATIRITIPSFEEQKKIVATLDKLDAKCKVLQDNYTNTIALCDDLKQALLRKAFNGEL